VKKGSEIRAYVVTSDVHDPLNGRKRNDAMRFNESGLFSLELLEEANFEQRGTAFNPWQFSFASSKCGSSSICLTRMLCVCVSENSLGKILSLMPCVVIT